MCTYITKPNSYLDTRTSKSLYISSRSSLVGRTESEVTIAEGVLFERCVTSTWLATAYEWKQCHDSVWKSPLWNDGLTFLLMLSPTMTNPSGDLVLSIKVVGDNDLDDIDAEELDVSANNCNVIWICSNSIPSFCTQFGFKLSSKKSPSSASVSPSHISIHSSSLSLSSQSENGSHLGAPTEQELLLSES